MNTIYGLDFNIKNSKIRFTLHKDAVEKLNNESYKFGFTDSNFGEIVFYRTYSRAKANGLKETWPETVLRVINGIMTIRKWWFKLHNLKWVEDDMQKVAFDMAMSMLKMHWLPPGRGIQNMGSDYVYERGSASLYNCAFVKVEDLAEDSAWIMDMLMCFTGDTKVSLMNGTEVTFEELVKNYSDKKFWVYSYDKETDKIVPGLAHSPRITKKNSPLVKVTLDNGEEIKCTPDHRFMMRDGSYREAKDLVSQDSLMPLYKYKKVLYGNMDYEVINMNGKEIPTHVLSGECVKQDRCDICNTELPDKKHCYRHHKDFNRYNNDPDNIQWMTKQEHFKLHSENASLWMTELNKIQWKDPEFIALQSELTSLRNISNWKNPEYRNKMTDILYKINSSENHKNRILERNISNWSKEEYRSKMTEVLRKASKDESRNLNKSKWNKENWSDPIKRQELISRMKKPKKVDPNHTRYHTNKGIYSPDCSYCVLSHPLNHKVISVENLIETQDVYDITVDKYHNFALSSGVIVHNCGVGVGFEVVNKDFRMYLQNKKRVWNYEIPDSKEGWVESTRDLIRSYRHPNSNIIKFDYSKIRPFGTPIKGFGGTASGPEPLMELHDRIRMFCEEYISGQINSVRLTADIVNCIGVCVVAGNVRRSAEIAIGSPTDDTFLNLKNYSLNPDRAPYGWMSNNTVRLSEKDHFDMIPQITERIIDNGEPGIMNLINVQKYGRYGQESPDLATGLNPCGEIPLESNEVCNLAEVFPTRCSSKEEFMSAIKAATLYSSTVSLYPTHSVRTNEVVARNRRIGVSISGISEWMDTYKTNVCVRWMKDAYRVVKDYNQSLATQAGVVPSVRLTTVKPSGSISQLVGVPSGMHFPIFKHAIRRIIVSTTSPIFEKLIVAGYEHEPVIKSLRADEFNSDTHKVFSKYTSKDSSYIHTEDQGSYVFEVPIYSGMAREAKRVSSWEQFSILSTLQRDWADNSVSATINFDRDTEANQLNHQLSQFIPVIKSVSILPHSDKGEYNQMPYEGITEEEYKKRVSRITPIDWESLKDDSAIQEEKFCTNDSCTI